MTAVNLRTPLTVLFMRSDSDRQLARVNTINADAVILDLEDAVAPEEKGRARRGAATVLAAVLPGSNVWVRVNGHGSGDSCART